MKKTKLILFLLLLPVMAAAQVKFGYISYSAVCKQMPQYIQAQQQLAELKAQYEKEAARGEEEFRRKYADFLQGQKDFPANILQKRQAELQDVMERSIAFRQEAQQLLANAEQDLMQNVYSHLNAAIAGVVANQGYAFVLNTDGNATPYINPAMGDDVTDLVRVRLGIIKANDIQPKVEPSTEIPVNPMTVDPVPTVQPVDTPAPATQSAVTSLP